MIAYRGPTAQLIVFETKEYQIFLIKRFYTNLKQACSHVTALAEDGTVSRIAFVLFFTLLTLAAPLALIAGPKDMSEGVAVVFAPWTDEATAMGRVGDAGGAVIRTGNLGFISIAIPASPEFAEDVRKAGAWLLLDPQIVGGCLTETNS